MKNEFNEYYLKYLGIKEENISKIVISRNRKEKINDFMYYPIIITKINEENVISISEDLYEEIKKEIDKNDLHEVIDIIKNIIERKCVDYKIKRMYRMVLHDILDIDTSKVIKIEKKHKKIFLNSKKKTNVNEDEKKWKKFKKYIDLRLLFWDTK